jgi:hypothetical protein
MPIAHIIILLGTGVSVGFASGLLGVGGGFIMTPVQYLLTTNMGVSTDITMKVAIGTSLLVIFFTVLSGAWRHHKKGTVYWKVAITMGSCGSLAAFGGATLASSYFSGIVLKILFGSVVLAGGVWMLISNPLKAGQEPKNNPWLWIAWAIPIGVMTGLTGLGGGVLIVPVMMLALKFKMHNAIATSLAIIIFTSAGGVVGYIINGLGVPDLPVYSIGYVNLLIWFLLAVTSIGMAQIGAMIAHRLPGRQLRWIFVAIMLYVGLRMLGAFDWLSWPL